jgi:hypothetical protein
MDAVTAQQLRTQHHVVQQEWDERGPLLPGETKTNRMHREPRDSLLTR